jgi:hypothetical protein
MTTTLQITKRHCNIIEKTIILSKDRNKKELQKCPREYKGLIHSYPHKDTCA